MFYPAFTLSCFSRGKLHVIFPILNVFRFSYLYQSTTNTKTLRFHLVSLLISSLSFGQDNINFHILSFQLYILHIYEIFHEYSFPFCTTLSRGCATSVLHLSLPFRCILDFISEHVVPGPASRLETCFPVMLGT